MVDIDKCTRCVQIASSWLGRPFEQINKRYQEKPDFRKEWQSAESNKGKIDEGEQLDWETPTGFHVVQRCGARVEVTFWFIACTEFHKKFELDPKQLGLATITLPDEENKDCKGVLVKPSAAEPPDCFRRVILWSEKSWHVDEAVVAPEKRLRERQAAEAYQHMNTEEIKKRPQDILGRGAVCSQAIDPLTRYSYSYLHLQRFGFGQAGVALAQISTLLSSLWLLSLLLEQVVVGAGILASVPPNPLLLLKLVTSTFRLAASDTPAWRWSLPSLPSLLSLLCWSG